MAAIATILGWLARKSILYLTIVLAILAAAFVLPWIRSEWTKPAAYLERAAQLERVKDELEAVRGAARERLATVAVSAQSKGLSELDEAIPAAAAAKAALEKRRRTALEKAKSLADADTRALLSDGRLEVEIQSREGELSALRNARDWLAQTTRVTTEISSLRQQAATDQAACVTATNTLAAFQQRWEVVVTFQYYDRERLRALQATKRQLCGRAIIYRQRLAAAEGVNRRLVAARQSYPQVQGWADQQIEPRTSDLDQQIARERTQAEGSWRARASLWAEQIRLGAVLKQAALALVLIVAVPYLIRLICYWVIAPTVVRSPAIRFQTTGVSQTIPPVDASSTSVGVRLDPGEELLVRQGYLQTTSASGAKATQWLLDWRHPITSLAAGLTFLTRVHGAGELTTVSAVRDPFAELTVLSLPDGAGLVLQPRGLAAIAKPIGRRLRISSHWRVLSLTAWLTLQLRFLVFHGPARLVIQGGRGVRVERAQQGRVLAQNQLVGFSTDLAYSVTRTETFWPYFFGREPLLKDRVAIGNGLLIVEEAPRTARGDGARRHGLEGLLDACMKAFGV
ncbi:MAG: hypothetical protein Q8R72_01285 [Hylemonella sp.]|nr:hypothetical protein [Hylemonella sp.]